MVSKFWRFATLYLVVGIFWAAFVSSWVEKRINDGKAIRQPGTLVAVATLASTFVWPITLPMGLYVLTTEK